MMDIENQAQNHPNLEYMQVLDRHEDGLMKLAYLKLVLKVLDLIQVQYVMEMEEKILLYQMQIFYLED